MNGFKDVDMFDQCLEKQAKVKESFLSCKTLDAVYDKIIDLGKEQTPLTDIQKQSSIDVPGCQSKMLLYAVYKDGFVSFQTESDALISAGLGVLLTEVYSGEAPETILKCPPTYIEDLGISKALSPNRSNGLASLHLSMKQIALKLFMENS